MPVAICRRSRAARPAPRTVRRAGALALTLISVLIRANTAAGQTSPTVYHVAVTGSDSTNAGTQAAPFLTIGKAMMFVSPGDTVKVHAGTYHEVVRLSRSGRPGSPIVLMTAGDGRVTVTADHLPQTCSTTLPTPNRTVKNLEGVDHWVIQGLEIVGGVYIQGSRYSSILRTVLEDRTLPGRGLYDPDAAERTLPNLGSNPADGIQLIANDVSGRGIFFGASRWGSILRNEVHDIECGGGAGIWLNRFSDQFVIRGNYVHDIAATEYHWMSEGIRLGGASMYNLVENNVAENLRGQGRGFTADINAGWNVIRHNTARTGQYGFSEQEGPWGNQWIGNLAEDNRERGFVIALKRTRTASAPDDDDFVHYMEVSCNKSVNNPEHVVIWSIANSSFRRNAFPEVRILNNLRNHWGAWGNRWEGSSQPPPPAPSTATYSQCEPAGAPALAADR